MVPQTGSAVHGPPPSGIPYEVRCSNPVDVVAVAPGIVVVAAPVVVVVAQVLDGVNRAPRLGYRCWIPRHKRKRCLWRHHATFD